MRRVRAVALAGSVLLLSGCIEADQSVNVNPDGSGSFSSSITFTRSDAEALGYKVCEPLKIALPSDVRVITSPDEARCTTVLEFNFANPEAFTDKVEEYNKAVRAARNPNAALGTLILEKNGEGGFDFRGENVVAMAINRSKRNLEPGDVSYELHVTLPELQGSTNATTVEGNTFHWRLDAGSMKGDRYELLYANTHAPTQQDTLLRWVKLHKNLLAAAGGVVALLALALYIRRRRQNAALAELYRSQYLYEEDDAPWQREEVQFGKFGDIIPDGYLPPYGDVTPDTAFEAAQRRKQQHNPYATEAPVPNDSPWHSSPRPSSPTPAQQPWVPQEPYPVPPEYQESPLQNESVPFSSPAPTASPFVENSVVGEAEPWRAPEPTEPAEPWRAPEPTEQAERWRAPEPTEQAERWRAPEPTEQTGAGLDDLFEAAPSQSVTGDPFVEEGTADLAAGNGIEPRWDEQLQSWVYDDGTQLLIWDDLAGKWKPQR